MTRNDGPRFSSRYGRARPPTRRRVAQIILVRFWCFFIFPFGQRGCHGL